MGCGCGQAVKQVVKKAGNIVEGFTKLALNVDTSYHVKRLAVCNVCIEHQKRRGRKCGCFISAKTRAEDEKRPLDKW